jgi:hypothetical protein
MSFESGLGRNFGLFFIRNFYSISGWKNQGDFFHFYPFNISISGKFCLL